MEMTNIQSHASHTKNINNHDNNHPFKTLPFAPGEKEKLICEKRRANRLERLKQVRQIEKKLAADRLAQHKSVTQRKQTRKIQQNQKRSHEQRVQVACEKLKQFQERIQSDDIGNAHRHAQKHQHDMDVRNKCLSLIQTENLMLAKHRGALAACAIRARKEQQQRKKHDSNRVRMEYARRERVEAVIRHRYKQHPTPSQLDATHPSSQLKRKNIFNTSSTKTNKVHDDHSKIVPAKMNQTICNVRDSISPMKKQMTQSSSNQSSKVRDNMVLSNQNKESISHLRGNLEVLDEMIPRSFCPMPIQISNKTNDIAVDNRSKDIHLSKNSCWSISPPIRKKKSLLQCDNSVSPSIQHSSFSNGTAPNPREHKNPNNSLWSISPPPPSKRQYIHRFKLPKRSIQMNHYVIQQMTPPPSFCPHPKKETYEIDTVLSKSSQHSEKGNQMKIKEERKTAVIIEENHVAPSLPFNSKKDMDGKTEITTKNEPDIILSNPSTLSHEREYFDQHLPEKKGLQSPTSIDSSMSSSSCSLEKSNQFQESSENKKSISIIDTQKLPPPPSSLDEKKEPTILNKNISNKKEIWQDLYHNLQEILCFDKSIANNNLSPLDLDHEITKLKILSRHTNETINEPFPPAFNLNLQARLEQVFEIVS